MNLPFGSSGYFVCPCGDCSGRHSVPVRFSGLRDALRFLEGHRGDSTAIPGMRRLVFHQPGLPDAVESDEDQFLERAAAAIQQRRVCIRRHWVKATMPVVEAGAAPAPPPPPKRIPKKAGPPPDRATLPPVDTAAMAGALRNAAAQGAPVCEICEKAKQAQEQKPVHWIEIELTDEEGNPIPGRMYVIVRPDGYAIRGYLDANGKARVDGMEDAGQCTVTFPEMDKETWQPG